MLIDTDVELSYWEGLRAYWRIYWPAQVAAMVSAFVYAMVHSGRAQALTALGLQALVGAIALFAFVPRIYSRPYRGFALVVLEPAQDAPRRTLDLRQRASLWWFLWWRQLAAGLIAGFLAMPTNMVLGIMGLHLSGGIAFVAGLLIIGPILMKLLIGNPFDDFRIEVQRRQPVEKHAEC
jgi:hypothetical protein